VCSHWHVKGITGRSASFMLLPHPCSSIHGLARCNRQTAMVRTGSSSRGRSGPLFWNPDSAFSCCLFQCSAGLLHILLLQTHTMSTQTSRRKSPDQPFLLIPRPCHCLVHVFAHADCVFMCTEFPACFLLFAGKSAESLHTHMCLDLICVCSSTSVCFCLSL
jgi:hypothetical protein